MYGTAQAPVEHLERIYTCRAKHHCQPLSVHKMCAQGFEGSVCAGSGDEISTSTLTGWHRLYVVRQTALIDTKRQVHSLSARSFKSSSYRSIRDRGVREEFVT